MRPSATARSRFALTLTSGGAGELTHLHNVVWTSDEDPDFLEEFPDFLTRSDVLDILDYLEEIGELTAREAAQCEIFEEFIDGADLAGMVR